HEFDFQSASGNFEIIVQLGPWRVTLEFFGAFAARDAQSAASAAAARYRADVFSSRAAFEPVFAAVEQDARAPGGGTTAAVGADIKDGMGAVSAPLQSKVAGIRFCVPTAHAGVSVGVKFERLRLGRGE